MTIPTTPGALGGVRASITETPPTSERSVTRHFARGSLLTALLATAAVALTSALAAAGAQAGPPPDPPRTYKVTADLDGRSTPSKDDVTMVDFLLKGERVPVECQTYGGRAYGSRLWDLVSDGGETLFVPDRFIRTGSDGRAPEIRSCDEQDLRDVTPPAPPHP
jgi:hypothetical protein